MQNYRKRKWINDGQGLGRAGWLMRKEQPKSIVWVVGLLCIALCCCMYDVVFVKNHGSMHQKEIFTACS